MESMAPVMRRATGSHTGFTLIELIVSIALIVILIGLSAGFIRVTTASELDEEGNRLVEFLGEGYDLATSRDHPVEIIYEDGSLVSAQVGDNLSFKLGEKFSWSWRLSEGRFESMETIRIRMDRNGAALPLDLQLKHERDSLLVQLKAFQGRAMINHDLSGK